MNEAIADFVRAATYQGGYNTSVVTLGVTLLGAAAGLIGLFAMLRRRALMGDALAHATLPGLACAFLIATALGMEGRSTPVLLLGAAAGGLASVGVVHAITKWTRLGEDTAIGIALSCLFGLGVVLLSVVQTLPTGGQAGLTTYLLGQTAAMRVPDAQLMGGVALVAALFTLVLFKELRLVCFDTRFATAIGRRAGLVDLLLMVLVVLAITAGIRAVGLVLVVALLVIPPAAARFWSDRLGVLALLSAGIGAVSGHLGASMSAAAPRTPAGGVIVLTAGAVFVVSMLAAPRRGLFARLVRTAAFRVRIARDHFLRSAFEQIESAGGEVRLAAHVDGAAIARRRGWSALGARTLGYVVRAQGLLDSTGRLTERGAEEASRITRRHRLWELFLVTHADVAASHVHDAADLVEHTLPDDVVADLESILRAEGRLPAVDVEQGGVAL